MLTVWTVHFTRCMHNMFIRTFSPHFQTPPKFSTLQIENEKEPSINACASSVYHIIYNYHYAVTVMVIV